jgi:hypothetical protein
VRAPSLRLARIASVTGGSIAEPGDSEFSIPGVLQPQIELSSPVDKAKISPLVDQQNDSFMIYDTVARAGVTGGISRVIATFAKGLWAIDWSATGAFSGTSNIALGSDDAVDLTDPDGAVIQLFNLPRITGVHLAAASSLRAVFQRDGWGLTLTTFATVAADNLRLTCAFNCRKLL